jgi:hypothetical protein
MNNLRGNKLKFFWWLIAGFICSLPLNHLIAIPSINKLLPRRIEYLSDFIAIIAIIMVMFSLDWNNLIRKNFKVLIIVVTLLISVIISSLVINPTTSYLFWPGISNELIPLLIGILLVVSRQEAETKIPKWINYLFLIVVLFEAVFTLTLNTSNNPNQSILIYLLCIATIYVFGIKGYLKHQLVPKLLIIAILIVNYIVSPITIIFSFLLLLLFFIKQHELPSKYIKPVYYCLILLIIFIGLSFNLTHLDENSKQDIYTSIQKSFKNNPNKVFMGYGIGNIGNSGIVNYGLNQELLVKRPFLNSLDGTTEIRNVASISNWLIQSIVNNGIIYAITFFMAMLYILGVNRRKDHLVYIIIFIITMSSFYDPLGNSNGYYLFAFSLFIL